MKSVLERHEKLKFSAEFGEKYWRELDLGNRVHRSEAANFEFLIAI